jgi:hypothetical protein
MFEKIDNYNAEILNRAMKEVREYFGSSYNFEFAMEYVHGLAKLSFDSALEWSQAFNYANKLTDVRPNPISLASYDIEEFLDFVDEA